MFGWKPTPKAFWKWFVRNEAMLFDFEKDQEKTFHLLATELQKIHSSLTFEFGPKINSIRDFVISADGIRAAFPAVIELAGAAPTLERWRVIALRPRTTPINAIEINDIKADPSQVEFSLIDNGTEIGVYLFIPGFDEKVLAWKQIGYLLLDEALGEYDVETAIGPIGMYSPESDISGERFPLPDLPAIFDRHRRTLHKTTGKTDWLQ